MANTLKTVLYGVGIGVLGGIAYAAVTGKNPLYYFTGHPDDADPATRNPWRGTGAPCEARFDGLDADSKSKIVAAVKAGQASPLLALFNCAA